jgi:hypothetical protein
MARFSATNSGFYIIPEKQMRQSHLEDYLE